MNIQIPICEKRCDLHQIDKQKSLCGCSERKLSWHVGGGCAHGGQLVSCSCYLSCQDTITHCCWQIHIQILKYKYENTQLQIYKYSWEPTGVLLLLLVTSHPHQGTIKHCCWQIHIQIQTNIYKNIDKYMEIKIYLNKNAKRIHKYKALSGQPSPRHHHILLLTNTYIQRHKYSITNTQI